MPNGAHDAMTDNGRPSRSSAVPTTNAGTSTSSNPLGEASSPSSTKSPICANHPIAVANPVTAGRWGRRRLPSTSAAR